MDVAYAIVAADKARAAVNAGDVISASGAFKRCQDAAANVKMDAVDLPIADADKKNDQLYDSLAGAGDDLGYGCESLRKFLDTQAPSDASDAKERFQGLSSHVMLAQYEAREHYSHLGGNPHDLLTYKDALVNAGQ